MTAASTSFCTHVLYSRDLGPFSCSGYSKVREARTVEVQRSTFNLSTFNFHPASLSPFRDHSSSWPPHTLTLVDAPRQPTLACFLFRELRNNRLNPGATNVRAMSHLLFSFLALALSLAPIASGVVSTCYKRELSIVGWDFFQEFTWFTEDDPTHGRVNYLSLEESKGKNLTYG